jgi:hypothetical protein
MTDLNDSHIQSPRFRQALAIVAARMRAILSSEAKAYPKKATCFADYKDYLESPHWHAVHRLWVESGYPTACIACGDGQFQLHHLNYDRLGHEHLRDLLPLCKACHERVHNVSERYGIPLSQPERALAIIFDWPGEEVSSRFANIRRCWAEMPLGDLNVRSRLFRYCLLVQCRSCGRRVWQDTVVCGGCGADCEIVFDWR